MSFIKCIIKDCRVLLLLLSAAIVLEEGLAETKSSFKEAKKDLEETLVKDAIKTLDDSPRREVKDAINTLDDAVILKSADYKDGNVRTYLTEQEGAIYFFYDYGDKFGELFKKFGRKPIMAMPMKRSQVNEAD